MNLGLAGQTVHTIAVDYAVSLLLDGDVTIRIATAFSLGRPSDQVVLIEPEQLGPGLEHILAVLHQTVADAVAREDGTLVMDFENGARVHVAAPPVLRGVDAGRTTRPQGRRHARRSAGHLGAYRVTG